MIHCTPAIVSTVMGGEQVPRVTVSEAFDIYCDEADELLPHGRRFRGRRMY